MRRRLLAVILALAIGNIAALGAHEDSPGAPSALGPTAAVRDEGPAPAEAPPVPTTGVPAKSGRVASAPHSGKPAPAADAKAASPVNFPVMSEGYAYDVQLTPSCARPGEVLTAVMRVKPNVQSTGTFMPFYSDGSYERGGGSLAEPDGTVRYSWVAQPIPGEGRLVTQAMEGDTGAFGTKVIPFRVVDRTTSC